MSDAERALLQQVRWTNLPEPVRSILAIDPGTTTSAWVWLDHDPLAFGMEPNEHLLARLRDVLVDDVVIERIEPRYGLNMGWETIETCEWVGRFHVAAPSPVTLLRRSAILKHLSVATTGKKADSGVRSAMLDRWGGAWSARKGGPLAGITSHVWQALGAGVAYREGLRPVKKEET